MATTQFAEILRVLDRFGVEFVLVGSTAAVLAGADFTTEAVDVVVDYSDANLSRLTTAHVDLDARYQDYAGRTIRPDERRLREHRINLLDTRLGRLDILRSIEPGRDYEALLDRTRWVEIDELLVRTVDLETLIEAEEFGSREREMLHLLCLRETLRSKRLKEGGA